MIKSHPKQLAIDISDRSNCRVKVGAVLVDKKGIFSWGWNNMGSDGMGCCAEQHAISRANPKRLSGASIYIYGTHRKTGNPVPAAPCDSCITAIYRANLRLIMWNNKDWGWEKYYV